MPLLPSLPDSMRSDLRIHGFDGEDKNIGHLQFDIDGRRYSRRPVES